jgi:two-component system, sensor histidine kinase and response regulator
MRRVQNSKIDLRKSVASERRSMRFALAARHAAQQTAEEELRELNATLESRIEQRTVELEGAVRVKSQFLANMSHEIRTPLNGVLGMLELVRQTELGPPQQRFIETARRSGETLLGVINGVLDLSKIEAGKIEIEHSAFDLRIVVEEVTELFCELAYGKGLELACFVPAALQTALIGDAGRLRQILTNLIGNAVKFTERGEVSVRVYALERAASSVLIAFEVVDTGIGIPAEKRRQIFEAFAQADSSTTRRYGGTGLGLSIAKHFCEMMGGSIDVVSEPGAGSKFRFTAWFGLQPSAADDTQIRLPPRTGGPALLVVDNALNREILEDQLSAGNTVVKYALTGSAALGALRTATLLNEPFELVIIDDHSLPDMTGVELAHAIETTSEGVEQQIILLTSFDRDVGQNAGGALRRLTKPIRQSALWECIAVSAQPGSATTSAPKTQAADQPGKGRAPVLVVEDSPVNLEVAVAILESMGCVVETAANGRHALDRHGSGEYSLIFMDCQMPEMDGFEATAEIRRREALSGMHTPIVALTASVVEDGRRRCLAVGMDDYLAKPFTLEQMSAMLTKWLGPPERPATRERLSLVMAAATPDPIDEQVLASLGRLQREGRSDIVQQLIELFFKGAAGLLMDLDNGAATGDAALLYRASHALGSASANLGAILLSTHCKELEVLSKAGTVTDAARLVNVIREDYRIVEARLSHRLPQVA